jgi:polyhydroxybutyrate depolymerase
MQRTYRLHVPSRLTAERAAPLVLVFHGGGGTPEQVERATGFSQVADREGFVVAYPAGHKRSWNDGRGAEAVAAQRDGVDDVAFVAALIDDVAATLRIDPARIYATGISNGAMVSHYVAIRLSTRFAAIAPVAGGLPRALAERFDAAQPVSVLLLNGTHDPLVPYGGGEVTVFGSTRGRIVGAEDAARRWSERAACSASPAVLPVAERDPGDGCTVTRLRYGNCSRGIGVEVYRLAGAGHTWPGRAQNLPERLVGKVCRDIDATSVIWEFFNAHPKP